jgi:hypothetical protein
MQFGVMTKRRRRRRRMVMVKVVVQTVSMETSQFVEVKWRQWKLYRLALVRHVHDFELISMI